MQNPCKGLDPDTFVLAFKEAMIAADSPNVVPMETSRPMDVDGERLKLMNTWLIRAMSVLRARFPDPFETLSAMMRIRALVALSQTGQLGGHYDPTRGVSDDALRALAQAPCDEYDGFDMADVRPLLFAQ